MKFNILHTEWSRGWGGQEIRILLDAQGLIERGHKVFILCAPESALANQAAKNGIPAHLMNIKHSFDPKALAEVVKFIKEKHIHVVNTHSSVDSWIASVAAKIAMVPVLIRTRHLSVPISTHVLNFVYKMPDAIITTGDSIRRTMIETNRFNGDKIFSIPTGVKLDVFSPDISAANLKNELGAHDGSAIVTMVAVLRSWKRHDVFIEAANRVLREYSKVLFLIVGDGPQRATIERKIADLKLQDKVIMTGYREDIPKILSVSDVCVLTSESSEGVPQSVLQYLAMERPVVATDAGSISQLIIPDKTGILVKPNDVEGVACSILKLLRDKELSRRLGKNGRLMVRKHYSYEAMLDKTLDIYTMIYRQKNKKLTKN